MGNSVASRAIERGTLYGRAGGRKYLNQREFEALQGVCQHLPARRRLLVETLLWSGARISEVLALSAGALQVEEGVVAIRTLKRRRHVVREIPLPRALMDELARVFDVPGSVGDGERREARFWPVSRTTGWRIIKRVMAEAGIAGLAASPKGMRHGFGIGAIHAGVPVTLVQRWLGHARLETTAIYLDAIGPEERRQAERFWEHRQARS